MTGYSAPLQVVGFVATKRGDAERGPQLRLRKTEAALRLLDDHEIAWVYGPRRHELVEIVLDDTVPRGCVIARDVLGVAPSEVIRIVKVGLNRNE